MEASQSELRKIINRSEIVSGEEGTLGQIISEPITDWISGQGTEEDPRKQTESEQIAYAF